MSPASYRTAPPRVGSSNFTLGLQRLQDLGQWAMSCTTGPRPDGPVKDDSEDKEVARRDPLRFVPICRHIARKSHIDAGLGSVAKLPSRTDPTELK